jgi:GNAT superfamily N-acetyltransferase
MLPVLIQAESPDHPDARLLLAELSARLVLLTGDSGQSSFCASDVQQDGACFVVARNPQGLPLACAAIRPGGQQVAELKRMYARPGQSGVAAQVLGWLEQQALQWGYRQICLAVRHSNPRAIAFYRKHGYAAIAPFGKYTESNLSLCMGKSLLPDNDVA